MGGKGSTMTRQLFTFDESSARSLSKIYFGTIALPGFREPVRLLGTRYTLEWTLKEQLCNHSYGQLASLHLKQGDVVVDVGANIGLFSVLLALLHPQVKILAFEASPLNALLAKRNIKLNNLDGQVDIKNLSVTGSA